MTNRSIILTYWSNSYYHSIKEIVKIYNNGFSENWLKSELSTGSLINIRNWHCPQKAPFWTWGIPVHTFKISSLLKTVILAFLLKMAIWVLQPWFNKNRNQNQIWYSKLYPNSKGWILSHGFALEISQNRIFLGYNLTPTFNMR